MKKKHRLMIAAFLAVALVALCLFAACKKGDNYRFAEREYEVKDGDTVHIIKGKASYKLIGAIPEGVSVSSDGKFAIASTAQSGAQTVLAAVVKGKIVDTAICKIITDLEKPTITFANRSNYLLDGERARAVSTPAYSLNYALKQNVDGVVIDEVTGRVSYHGAVADGTHFTVVASALGERAEMEFLAATDNFVTVADSEQFSELGVGTDVRYTLEFGDNEQVEQAGVLEVEVAGNLLPSDKYEYDFATHVLKVHGDALQSLGSGANSLYITTGKNTVTVSVNVAKFVRTAEDLAAIARGSIDDLNSYYVQVADIDLTDYLDSEEYGWFPIGTYSESDSGVIDATRVFGGHYDGNGHTISGLWIARRGSTFIEGFNGGLFGYVSSNGIVENIMLYGAEGRENALNSYSGGLAGHNAGIIRNCIVDVNVALIDEHRVGGGVCGMNEGTIANCISLGFVTAGKEYGAICGWSNLGVITDCYAVDDPNSAYRADHSYYVYPDRPTMLPAVGTDAGTTERCTVYGSVESLLQGADFSSWSNWTVTYGELPTVRSKTIG